VPVLTASDGIDVGSCSFVVSSWLVLLPRLSVCCKLVRKCEPDFFFFGLPWSVSPTARGRGPGGGGGTV